MPQTTKTVHYFAGLDLGQSQEFTALAVLERACAYDEEMRPREPAQYAVRHLERFPPGTPFPAVGARVAALFATGPLGNGTLVVDQTGVGKPVVDLLRKAQPKAYVRPVTVTVGHHAVADEHGGWLVPKKELVSTLQILLQSRRLLVAEALPEAATLVRELTNFQAKVVLVVDDPYVAWREGAHDDLVLAIAIAAWEAERCRSFHIWIGTPYVLGEPTGWLRRGW